jgi:pimeloyl-ACP methyl ester carboxylesterase
MPQASPQPSPGDLQDDQILALLRSGAHAALMSAYFGEAEYRELCHLAKLAATRRNPRGKRVFVLPGIMGSRIGATRGRSYSLVWLHPTAIANGSLMQLAIPGPRSIRAVGVMLPGYLKLRLSLEVAGFRPLFFPFDWRLDLTQLARGLTRAIEASGERKALVVGHSMGGLVARAALGSTRIGRLVQLGAPNDGSFAPVQAFRAVYPTVRKIAALDRGHTAEELARTVFRTLPGLYQMLPSAESSGDPDLFDASAWPEDDLVPDSTMLTRARKVRSRLPAADDRCSVIVGTNQETITSVAKRDGGFEYSLRMEGDGTVPVTRAQWADAATWFVNENHGALTQNDAVISAVVDILKTGTTKRLPSKPTRPNGAVTRSVCDRDLRLLATHKVQWDTLSLDSRRRILEPVISAEFSAPVF